MIRTSSYFRCPAATPCDGAGFEYPAEAVAHLREEHPGEPVPLHLPTARTPDHRPPPLRIMHCRFCAVPIETYDPEAVPYCDEHAARRTTNTEES